MISAILKISGPDGFFEITNDPSSESLKTVGIEPQRRVQHDGFGVIICGNSIKTFISFNSVVRIYLQGVMKVLPSEMVSKSWITLSISWSNSSLKIMVS